MTPNQVYNTRESAYSCRSARTGGIREYRPNSAFTHADAPELTNASMNTFRNIMEKPKAYRTKNRCRRWRRISLSERRSDALRGQQFQYTGRRTHVHMLKLK
jgi:hypothetical protein